MKVTVLARGLGFTEGPTITSRGELVVVSIDQGNVFCIGASGVTLLAATGGGPNGATSDADDVVYLAQNGGNWMHNPHPGRREPGLMGGVQRLDADGPAWLSREPLAPNDLCFGPDGLLYVTDPTRDGKYDDGRIWRIDPASGEAEVFARVPWFCNGIAFGPDDALYVASTGDRRIVRLDGADETVCRLDQHAPDGFAFDVDGNLAVGALARGEDPGEVQVWSLDGELLDRVRVGDGPRYTNVALSGNRRLAVTDSAGGSVLCVEGWPAAGLALYPLRGERRTAPDLVY